MAYNTFLSGLSEAEYKDHFIKNYCREKIYTHDHIRVKFSAECFSHAFFESSDRRLRNKDIFSIERAKRMDWIKVVLQDVNAEMYIGWDSEKKDYDSKRRLSLIVENYVVVIRFINDEKTEAKFVTAYPVSTKPTGGQLHSTYDKIRSGPKWR